MTGLAEKKQPWMSRCIKIIKTGDVPASHVSELRGVIGIFTSKYVYTISANFKVIWWTSFCLKKRGVPSPETKIFAPENGWVGRWSFPFGARPIFRGELLVSESVTMIQINDELRNLGIWTLPTRNVKRKLNLNRSILLWAYNLDCPPPQQQGQMKVYKDSILKM